MLAVNNPSRPSRNLKLLYAVILGSALLFIPGISYLPRRNLRGYHMPLSISRFRNPLRHAYHSDGLLMVNPNATHPIPELIERAREAWNAKLHRQSRTLEEAVEEYTQRYHRPPPKGFDLWWNYVQTHNVQLPDEYDSIHEKIQPFWGVSPDDLQAIESDWEDDPWQSVTWGKNSSGNLQILKNSLNSTNKDELENVLRYRIDFLREVEHMLPDFRAIASPFDNPNLVWSWEFKDQLLNLATSKTYLNMSEPVPKTQGYIGTCHPNSTARLHPPDLRAQLPGNYTPRAAKTFIYDHRVAMDPCLHPLHFIQEGEFVSHNTGPGHTRKPIPQFSFSSTTLHADLPFIPMDFGDHEDIPWASKTDERLLWRGRDTGMRFNWNWEQCQRPRLVKLAVNMTGTAKVLAPPEKFTVVKAIGQGKVWKKSALMPFMMDVAFGGSSISPSEEFREELQAVLPWEPYMSVQEANKYKYVIDVDGNAWSNRFRRLMLSNSVVLKSTIYPEWFTERIQPWLHYVPVSVDYSELLDVLMFFRGEPSGRGRHDHLAERIGVAGRRWAETFWRKEDCIAYMFRLILEYARVMNSDRDSMNYVPKDS